MNKEGKIYILRNPYLKEAVIKIGRTSRISEQRAKEISNSTGVPFEYEVLYEEDVLDCHLAEKLVYNKLNNNRINKKREFFNIPLKKAVKTVFEICLEVNKSLLPQDASRMYILIDDDRRNKNTLPMLHSILSKHLNGSTEIFIEYKKDDVTVILSLGEDFYVKLSPELINSLKNNKKITDVIWASTDLKTFPEYENDHELPL